ncbi:VOC family protein [Rhizobium sp. 768_B6_N1_8]|uniref:VOC family protein n=1 Tax=unclassified Rhizobium TaxID=2613769 RepID=UPI003F27FCA4
MPRLDHVTIDTRNAPVMISFLESILGVKEGYRPPFPTSGHWLYLDDKPVIHLSLTSRTADFPPGILNHVAFSLFEFEPALARIKASGYRYEYLDIPDTELGQVFVYGPEGVKIELQYKRPI